MPSLMLPSHAGGEIDLAFYMVACIPACQRMQRCAVRERQRSAGMTLVAVSNRDIDRGATTVPGAALREACRQVSHPSSGQGSANALQDIARPLFLWPHCVPTSRQWWPCATLRIKQNSTSAWPPARGRFCTSSAAFESCAIAVCRLCAEHVLWATRLSNVHSRPRHAY